MSLQSLIDSPKELLELINECLNKVETLYPILESEHISILTNISVIRKNRFTDKLLWIGLKEKTQKARKPAGNKSIAASGA